MFDKIIAHTSFIGETGYANHSRNFFTALNKIIPVKIRNFSVGKSWKGIGRGNPHDEEWYLTEEHKNMLYKQTCLTNRGREDFYIYGGDKRVEEGNNLHIVLNEANHYYFYDNYNGPKIAYNVWESTLYDENFYNKLLEFDQLWVPTQWQKDCVVSQGYFSSKVRIIPEAVDGSIFFPETIEKMEEYKDGRFKFLLFGRWDYRKSTKEILNTFVKTFSKEEPVDIIASIDNGFASDNCKNTEERLFKNGIIDDRIKVKHFPSRQDYVNYLKTGHVFLSCARSEGWNLPLIEAMACGTPSIYSDWGAQLEFSKGKGLPVKIIGEREAFDGKDEAYRMTFDEISGNYCEPDYEDLGRVMRDVYENYNNYKKEAEKESLSIREEFTWENAAQKSYNVIKDFYRENRECFCDVLSLNDDEIILKDGCNTLNIFRKDKSVKVEIIGEEYRRYRVSFYDHNKSNSIYDSSIVNNQWCATDINNIDILIRVVSSHGLLIMVKYDFLNNVLSLVEDCDCEDVLLKVREPVIICGNIGGGTSFISKLLRFRGLFMGDDCGNVDNRKNHESKLFSSLASIVFERVGFEQNRKIEINDRDIKLVIEHIENNSDYYAEIFKKHICSKINYFFGNNVNNLNNLWGWKSPYNGLFIPIFNKIFPKAKIVGIVKNKNEEEISLSAEGEWFNKKSTDFVRSVFSIEGERGGNVRRFNFEDITSNSKCFNELCEWIGLESCSEEEYNVLLCKAGFEKGLDNIEGVEVYQDIYINGNIVIKGIRDCENRYKAMKEVFSKYNRRFSILDIGANFGYYSIRASDEYGALSFMIEGKEEEARILSSVCEKNRSKDNLIVANSVMDVHKIRELSKCEHFDVILALNVIHHFELDHIEEVCELFEELGDNLIIETPPNGDEGSCGQNNIEAINRYLDGKDKILLGEFKRHTSDKYSKLYWIKTPKTELKSTYYLYDSLKYNGSVDDSLINFLEKKPFKVYSDYDCKNFYNPNNGEKRKWIDGINLYTFHNLNGVYPSPYLIADNIINKKIETGYKWDNSSRDIVAHNFILEGSSLHLIDYKEKKIYKDNLDNDEKQLREVYKIIRRESEKKDIVILSGADEVYEPFVKICVEQILKKTENIPVCIFGFDSSLPSIEECNLLKIDNLSIKNIKKCSNLADNTFHFAKIEACIRAIDTIDSEYYVWIDSDSYVTENISNIYKYCEEIDNYPLCMVYRDWSLRHWRDIKGETVYSQYGEEIVAEFNGGFSRSNDFIVAAGMFIFNKSCRDFFEEVIRIGRDLREKNDNKKIFIDDNAFSEERIFNLLMWKYGYKKHLPITWISKGWKSDSKFNLNNIKDGIMSEMIDKDYDLMYIFEKDRIFDVPKEENIVFFHSKPRQKKALEVKDLIDKYNIKIGGNMGVKLNLGCSSFKENGYINIDLYHPNADVKMDALCLDYGDQTVDKIRAYHILEHFSKGEVILAIKEWERVLKKGGEIEIEVPDLEFVLLQWLQTGDDRKDDGWMLDCIYGSQESKGEFHKTGFTRNKIVKLMENNGFVDVNVEHVVSHDILCFRVFAKKG